MYRTLERLRGYEVACGIVPFVVRTLSAVEAVATRSGVQKRGRMKLSVSSLEPHEVQ